MTDAHDIDVLGAPYTQQTLHLGFDSEGEVVTTLVHLPAARPTYRAVLHVHGFADHVVELDEAAGGR